jgi:hypothetical protein
MAMKNPPFVHYLPKETHEHLSYFTRRNPKSFGTPKGVLTSSSLSSGTKTDMGKARTKIEYLGLWSYSPLQFIERYRGKSAKTRVGLISIPSSWIMIVPNA